MINDVYNLGFPQNEHNHILNYQGRLQFVYEYNNKMKTRQKRNKSILKYQIILTIFILSNACTFIYLYFQKMSLSKITNDIATTYEKKIHHIKQYLMSQNIVFLNNEINDNFNISDVCNYKYTNKISNINEERKSDSHFNSTHLEIKSKQSEFNNSVTNPSNSAKNQIESGFNDFHSNSTNSIIKNEQSVINYSLNDSTTTILFKVSDDINYSDSKETSSIDYESENQSIIHNRGNKSEKHYYQISKPHSSNSEIFQIKCVFNDFHSNSANSIIKNEQSVINYSFNDSTYNRKSISKIKSCNSKETRNIDDESKNLCINK